MANRTLNFYGFAYGNVPVQLNAHINGQVVFSGEVATIDESLPLPSTIVANTSVLFSVTDSALFPTEFSGSYPMTISVATGNGIAIADITSNYMPTGNYTPVVDATMDNTTINGTTLTVGTLVSGTIAVGQLVDDPNNETTVAPGTTITAGSDLIWTVSNVQNVTATTLQSGHLIPISSGAAEFLPVFNGTPTNSEGTPDPRSSVQIDGVTQVPPNAVSTGIWTWIVSQGSTLSCNLNVSVGAV